MKELVYRSTDYINNTILSSSDVEEPIIDTFVKQYFKTINLRRAEIDNIFINIYGQIIDIPENEISLTLETIKDIKERSGKSIEQICDVIRKYVGHNILFYKDVTTPISLNRIRTAYALTKVNATQQEIENCLQS